MIDFNRSPVLGTEKKYFEKVLASGKLCGDGPFTAHASEWFRNRFSVKHCYLTTSCTSALEMASWLCDLQPGDEVIMPSYTFVSTADAFVLRVNSTVIIRIPKDSFTYGSPDDFCSFIRQRTLNSKKASNNFVTIRILYNLIVTAWCMFFAVLMIMMFMV